MRLTESGWRRSGVTGDGRGVRVMGVGVGDGGGSGVCVGGSVGGGSQS